MKFECPTCHKAGSVDDARVPAEGIYASCPKCETRFLLKKEPVKDFTFEAAEELDDNTPVHNLPANDIVGKEELSVTPASSNNMAILLGYFGLLGWVIFLFAATGFFKNASELYWSDCLIMVAGLPISFFLPFWGVRGIGWVAEGSKATTDNSSSALTNRARYKRDNSASKAKGKKWATTTCICVASFFGFKLLAGFASSYPGKAAAEALIVMISSLILFCPIAYVIGYFKK